MYFYTFPLLSASSCTKCEFRENAFLTLVIVKKRYGGFRVAGGVILEKISKGF